MARFSGTETGSGLSGPDDRSARSRRDLLWRTLLRLLLVYLAPFILLTIYFHFQSLEVRDEADRRHLQAIAEYQANMLDLYVRERAVNLGNLIDDPALQANPDRETLAAYLEELRRDSAAFVDLGFFDASGIQIAYTGPFPVLESRDYSGEAWFRALRTGSRRYVITDVYLGFRERPHFTIAVGRELGGRFVALRSTIDPESIYEFITSLEGARDVRTSIVNLDGVYQVGTPHLGTLLAESRIVPPGEPRLGVREARLEERRITYGYSWLVEADWALITVSRGPGPNRYLLGGDWKIAAVALTIILLILWSTIMRARRQVRIETERDETRRQLEQAAKLATVGELAGGVAHEINNPLAIISEEAGLMRDLMDPRFGGSATPADLRPHLDVIHDAVFRCRDITRKLLGFVRRTEFRLERQSVAALVDEVVEGFLGREIALANIEIERDYDQDVPEITTDGNQLKQVFLNLFTNAVDAIDGAGTIRIAIRRAGDRVEVAVSDTGKGMSKGQIDKVFMPFYTTKEVGKGTGLGLSVSYGIVKGLGGTITVRSEPGQGSTFTVSLPVR